VAGAALAAAGAAPSLVTYAIIADARRGAAAGVGFRDVDHHIDHHMEEPADPIPQAGPWSTRTGVHLTGMPGFR
jgi:hypothetical protein